MMGSDHRPIFRTFAAEEASVCGKFSFEKRWLSKPGIGDIIYKGWKGGRSGDALSLSDCIASCRRAL